jgi:hypothetical protein
VAIELSKEQKKRDMTFRRSGALILTFFRLLNRRIKSLVDRIIERQSKYAYVGEERRDFNSENNSFSLILQSKIHSCVDNFQS